MNIRAGDVQARGSQIMPNNTSIVAPGVSTLLFIAQAEYLNHCKIVVLLRVYNPFLKATLTPKHLSNLSTRFQHQGDTSLSHHSRQVHLRSRPACERNNLDYHS